MIWNDKRKKGTFFNSPFCTLNIFYVFVFSLLQAFTMLTVFAIASSALGVGQTAIRSFSELLVTLNRLRVSSSKESFFFVNPVGLIFVPEKSQSTPS